MSAPGPVVHTCHVCGVDHAPFGFGRPGPAKDNDSEGVLWACRDHREAVERASAVRFGGRLPGDDQGGWPERKGGPSAPLAAKARLAP